MAQKRSASDVPLSAPEIVPPTMPPPVAALSSDDDSSYDESSSKDGSDTVTDATIECHHDMLSQDLADARREWEHVLAIWKEQCGGDGTWERLHQEATAAMHKTQEAIDALCNINC